MLNESNIGMNEMHKQPIYEQLKMKKRYNKVENALMLPTFKQFAFSTLNCNFFASSSLFFTNNEEKDICTCVSYTLYTKLHS